MGKNTGLVYTNEKCIVCNKCISVCPVPSANYAVKLADVTKPLFEDIHSSKFRILKTLEEKG